MVYPVIILVIMIAFFTAAWYWFPEVIRREPLWAVLCVWLPEGVFLAVLVWVLSFFRNPVRTVPEDPTLLLAPADGTIRDIEEVREPALSEGPALRIGIFLSIFNVHINRMPCAVRVESVTYKRGKFLNAMNRQSGRVNESNNLLLRRTADPADRLLVRQISGAIARRIVCEAEAEQVFQAGQPFGMIKFGSRTELLLPVREGVRVLVKVGEKVQAGTTPLVRYES